MRAGKRASTKGSAEANERMALLSENHSERCPPSTKIEARPLQNRAKFASERLQNRPKIAFGGPRGPSGASRAHLNPFKARPRAPETRPGRPQDGSRRLKTSQDRPKIEPRPLQERSRSEFVASSKHARRHERKSEAFRPRFVLLANAPMCQIHSSCQRFVHFAAWRAALLFGGQIGLSSLPKRPFGRPKSRPSRPKSN